MRIGDDRAVAGEMLGGRRHAGGAHALHAGDGEARDGLRVAVIGAVADHLAHAVVEVDAGREAQVDADRAQLGGEQPAALPGQATAGFGIEVVDVADRALRRQHGEPAAEALHAAALVVHRHEQRRLAHGVDLAHQRLELARCCRSCGVNRITEPTSGWASTRRSSAVSSCAGHVDHQRPERHGAAPRRARPLRATGALARLEL